MVSPGRRRQAGDTARQSDAPTTGQGPQISIEGNLLFFKMSISTVLLSLPLIQVGQLSVTGESMGTYMYSSTGEWPWKPAQELCG